MTSPTTHWSPRLSTMVRALIAKECMKLRWAAALPFAVLVAYLVNYSVTLSTVMQAHGALSTVLGLYAKSQILFTPLAALGVGSAALLAWLQVWPDTTQGRLRLALHLPVSAWVSQGVTVAVGMAYLAIWWVSATLILTYIHQGLHLPHDYVTLLNKSLGAWALASVVAWCAVAAALLETSRLRALGLVAFGCAYIYFLVASRVGYDPMAHRTLEMVAWVLPWVVTPLAAALRLKARAKAFHLVRLAPLGVGVVALSFFLTQATQQLTRPDIYRAASYYSPTLNTFVTRHMSPTLNEVRTADGTRLNARQVRQALPFLYRADLLKWHQFPLTIGSHVFTFEEAGQTQQSRVSPLLYETPIARVTALLESEPAVANLTLPPDYLVVRPSGFEFLNATTGEVHREQTQAFAAALQAAQVTWPITHLATNPTTLKPFDEGALFIDSAQRLYQMKLVRGQPWVRVLADRVPAGTRWLSLEENLARDYLGLLVADDGLYLIPTTGPLLHLKTPHFDVDSTSISLWSTPLTRTLTLQNYRPDALPGPQEVWAFDRQRAVAHDALLTSQDAKATFVNFAPEDVQAARQMQLKILNALLPLHLEVVNPLTQRFEVRLVPPLYVGWALWGGLFFAALSLGIDALRARSQRWPMPTPRGQRLLGMAISFVFGLAGLAAYAWMSPLGDSTPKATHRPPS